MRFRGKGIVRRLVASGVAMTALLGASVAFADPIPESGMGMPRDVSRDGHRIDWLINVTTAFVALLFVIMCIWMAWAVMKHGKDHEAEYDHGDSKHHVAIAMGISALIFFVVDGNLWFNSTVDVNTLYWNHELAESHSDAVRIEINAHQWAWDARYAGPDGKFNTRDDVVSLNDIRIPVDTPVLFQIASSDVIHSFYLPNFRNKIDAMPGMITRMWIWPKETGEFDIACAQHCGVHHYKMKGLLTVMEKDEHARWIKAMSDQHAIGYDENDTEADWGWTWMRADQGTPDKTAKRTAQKTAEGTN
jgi:cytochrome c oxidase subunit 2